MYLFIDLETTGFDPKYRNILQISAVSNLNEHDIFNEYLLPVGKISKGASDLTNLNMRKGKLYHGDKLLTVVDKKTGLVRIVNYLQSLKQQYGAIIVVGHNVAFDLRFLYNKLKDKCLWVEFESSVSGVVDSLQLFREYYPGRDKYSLTCLAEHFTGDRYLGHNSLDDAKMLKNLSALIHEYFPKFTVSLSEYEKILITKK